MLTLCSKYENLSFSAKLSVSRSEVNFFAPQHNISACPRQERMEFQPCSFDTPETIPKTSFLRWAFHTEHVKQSGWKSIPDTFMILKDN